MTTRNPELDIFPFGLSPEVLTDNPDDWVPPTPEQVRVVVGLRSVTRVSATAAARLIGLTDRSFRKYLASREVENSAKISYAAWHLLLHRLDVQTSKIIGDDWSK